MCAALLSATETYPMTTARNVDGQGIGDSGLPIAESPYDELVSSGPQVLRRPGLTVPLLITFLTVGGAAAPFSTRLMEAPNILAHANKVSARPGTGSPTAMVIEQDDRVHRELAEIRALTGLSVNDIARLCGIKRRQVYNLLDGSETEPHRAANIRRISQAIGQWSHRFQRPETLRSALLAPIGDNQEDFITLASSPDQAALAMAIDRFEEYLRRLGRATPAFRSTATSPAGRRQAVEQLRDLYGDNITSSDA